jgi:hypothetical protein
MLVIDLFATFVMHFVVSIIWFHGSKQDGIMLDIHGNFTDEYGSHEGGFFR